MSELSLKISGKKFDFFNGFNLSLSYNSIASIFSFDGLKNNTEQKNLFKPLSYHEAKVYFGNELLLTGTILNTSTSSENTDALANISGYSKTGVLEDCEIPVSLYPLQSDKLSLKEIAEKLIKPFGIKLIVSNQVLAEASKKYENSNTEPDSSIASYLLNLAKQRKIVITHDASGNLVFTRTITNERSVATYIEGMPSTKISLSVNGQGFHSDISVLKQASLEVDTTGEKAIQNNLIPQFRPTVKKQSAGDNDDTESSAESIRSSELRNIVLTIETDRWKWTDGKNTSIIKPNHIIEVQSPSNYLKNRTRFFVEKVDYKGDNESISATLTCVLPEVYTGGTPKNVFA